MHVAGACKHRSEGSMTACWDAARHDRWTWRIWPGFSRSSKGGVALQSMGNEWAFAWVVVSGKGTTLTNVPGDVWQRSGDVEDCRDHCYSCVDRHHMRRKIIAQCGGRTVSLQLCPASLLLPAVHNSVTMIKIGGMLNPTQCSLALLLADPRSSAAAVGVVRKTLGQHRCRLQAGKVPTASLPPQSA